jgi:hypothetical protein
MTHFPKSSRRHPYSVITPDTPLETLESFFLSNGTDFALGELGVGPSDSSYRRRAQLGPGRRDQGRPAGETRRRWQH